MRIALIVLGAIVVLLIGTAIWLYAPDKSRAELEQHYLATPSDYVMVAGIRLHLRDTGPRDAPAVILLHGFGSSLQTWDGWIPALSADHRVIRFDLPGFGLTGPDPTADYSDSRGEAVLAAVMDHLGLARASLVGNSMGGRIAWRFAADHPDRVDKLVLISPDGFASPGFEYGKAPEVGPMIKMMRYVLPTGFLRASLAPAYGDPKALTDATVTRYRDLMLAPGVRDAMIARMEQTIPENPEPMLRRIQAPVLLLWGEKDGMIPFSNAADYQRALPNATLVSFPELGHVPFEEAPEKTLPPVLTFLAP